MINAYYKKTFTFLCLFSFLSTFLAYSQNTLDAHWGVKGGLNLNKTSQVEYINNYKPGFHFGLFANFQMKEKISIQHEVLYSMKGISIDLSSGNGMKYSKSFSFLELPLLVNYHLSPTFMITAGLQPSIYTYFKNPKPDPVVYNKDNVSIIDFGYVIGASFLFSNNLGFGIRFNGGLVPAFDYGGFHGRNYVVQTFLTYAVNKIKRKNR